MPEALIRLANSHEAEEICHLMLEAFSPYRDLYTEACFDATVLDAARIQDRMEEGPVWVAISKGIVGTCGAVVDGDRLYIRGMAVHPNAQRQGLSRRLLDAAQAYGKKEGCHALWLSTTRFLLASQAAYAAAGFVPAPGPADLHGTPLVSFEKRLDQTV